MVTFNTSRGFIQVFYYYTTTNISVGTAAEMLQYEKVKQGSSATKVTVQEVWYTFPNGQQHNGLSYRQGDSTALESSFNNVNLSKFYFASECTAVSLVESLMSLVRKLGASLKRTAGMNTHAVLNW